MEAVRGTQERNEHESCQMKGWHRHYHSLWRRGAFSFALVAAVMAVGTAGMHAIEHLPYLDAFYFMSMLATAQGPTLTPATPLGKLFAASMSFVCTGTVVAALGFLFGPFFARFWRLSVRKLEEEEKAIETKLKKRL